MAKQVDYYEYWNKQRAAREPLLAREKQSFAFINSVAVQGARVLDAGCGHGKFMTFMKEQRPDLKLEGLEYSKAEIDAAEKRGFKVAHANFDEDGFPLKKESYDVVYAGEVIEHLYNPDHFLAEVHRVLKPHGYLVLSTPNLCAWFNRILMLIGTQPLFVEPSTTSKLVGAGMLKKLKKDAQPVGHVRIMTIAALKDLLIMNGLKLEKVVGNEYEEGFPPQLLPIDRLFAWLSPHLAGQLVLIARKK